MIDILCLDPNGIYLNINSYFCFQINKLEMTDHTHNILTEYSDLFCGIHLSGNSHDYSLKDIVLYLSAIEDNYEIIPKFINLRIDNRINNVINGSLLSDLLDFYRDYEIQFNIICNEYVNPIKTLVDYILFHESYGRFNIGLCLDLGSLVNKSIWLNKEIQDGMGNYIHAIYHEGRLQIK